MDQLVQTIYDASHLIHQSVLPVVKDIFFLKFPYTRELALGNYF